MITVSRLATVAAVAAVAFGAIACSSAPDEPVSVDVDTDQVDPSCVKGGINCGVTGTYTGGKLGGSFGGFAGGGLVLDPGPTGPEPSVAPDDCGDQGCRWNDKGNACVCGGAGYGLYSTVTCSSWSYPCPRSVLGSVRCYKAEADGSCR